MATFAGRLLRLLGQEGHTDPVGDAAPVYDDHPEPSGNHYTFLGTRWDPAEIARSATTPPSASRSGPSPTPNGSPPTSV